MTKIAETKSGTSVSVNVGGKDHEYHERDIHVEVHDEGDTYRVTGYKPQGWLSSEEKWEARLPKINTIISTKKE